jgi:hypothetical protein
MAIIELDNFEVNLAKSTVGRSGTPDGNVFFDVQNGLIEFLSATEIATIDLSGVAGINEKVQISISGAPTAGTFTLTFETVTSGAIQWNSTSAQLQTVLEAMSNIGVGDVAVTGGDLPGTALVIEFTGLLEESNRGDITLGVNSLTGGSTPTPSFSVTQSGAASGITTGAITINVNSSGTFTRTTGDFVADGFKAGRDFAHSGHTSGGNNNTFTALTVTTTVMTVTDATGMVTEAGTGSDVCASTTQANPLILLDGIKLEAVYAFEKQERLTDETLRTEQQFMTGSFKFAGAYSFVNSRKPASAADRGIIRGSGWNEIALDGGVDRTYFGNKGLANIEATSQPYYQLSDGGEPFDFTAVGQINEAVQVLGTTANVPSDSAAGDFDFRIYEAVSVRTYGQNYDRKETTTDLAITELGGFATGFALQESVHLTTGSYALADVYGGSQISPWTGMTLEKLVTPQTETGFVETDGDFTWVLNNTAAGNLDQCVAFLDALAQTDDDIDTGAVTITRGKRVNTWYSYNASGKIITRSGADALGLFIEQIPTVDEQRIIFTDDTGATKTNPSILPITVNVVDSVGTAIENANVYMIADSGGPQAQGTEILKTLTSASGVASGSSSVATNQPVSGWVRKATGSPFYKTSVYSSTINSNNGVVVNIIMLDDE